MVTQFWNHQHTVKIIHGNLIGHWKNRMRSKRLHMSYLDASRERMDGTGSYRVSERLTAHTGLSWRKCNDTEFRE